VGTLGQGFADRGWVLAERRVTNSACYRLARAGPAISFRAIIAAASLPVVVQWLSRSDDGLSRLFAFQKTNAGSGARIGRRCVPASDWRSPAVRPQQSSEFWRESGRQ